MCIYTMYILQTTNTSFPAIQFTGNTSFENDTSGYFCPEHGDIRSVLYYNDLATIPFNPQETATVPSEVVGSKPTHQYRHNTHQELMRAEGSGSGLISSCTHSASSISTCKLIATKDLSSSLVSPRHSSWYCVAKKSLWQGSSLWSQVAAAATCYKLCHFLPYFISLYQRLYLPSSNLACCLLDRSTNVVSMSSSMDWSLSSPAGSSSIVGSKSTEHSSSVTSIPLEQGCLVTASSRSLCMYSSFAQVEQYCYYPDCLTYIISIAIHGHRSSQRSSPRRQSCLVCRG